MVEDLNLGKPRTNPASGQSGTQTRDRRIACPTSWPLGRAYMGRQTVGKSDMLVTTRKTFSRSFSFFVSQTFLSLFSSAGSVWEALVSTSRSEKWRTTSGIQVHSPRGQKSCKEISVFFFLTMKYKSIRSTLCLYTNKNHRHTSQFINPLVYILFSSKNQTFAARNCANT